MSWYCFGGFSAYWIVPSGRCAEPLGMLARPRGGRASTGRRGRARSRCRAPRAAATRRSKSSSVPSSGWIAVWPPSARADRPRAADVAGLAVGALFGPLRMRAADRVDRRQVEHVEAHRRDVGRGAPRRRRRCRGGRARRWPSAGTARTRSRSAPARGRPRPASGAGSSTAKSRSRSAAHQLRGAAALRAPAGRRASSGRLERRRDPAPSARAAAASHEAPADLEVDGHVLARVDALREIAAATIRSDRARRAPCTGGGRDG